MATPILMPRQGQSVESCILTTWKVRAGDPVKTGQPVASIETDKATFDVESPAEGTVLELFFNEGDDIPVLTHIAAVGQPGEDVTAIRPGGRASVAAPTLTQPSPAGTPDSAPPVVQLATQASPSSGISPRARRTAQASGLDPSTLSGSGPGGRVIERDVRAAQSQAPHLSMAARAAGTGHPPIRGSGPGGMVLMEDLRSEIRTPTSEIPVRGIRKIVAERMRQSLAGTAQLTLTRTFDATALQLARTLAKERGEKLTINDLICLATVKTLATHPALNAHFLGNRIVQHTPVNLGIAVDTTRGLMVPVVADAGRLSRRELSAAIKRLAEDCQKGSINPDLLAGGTFTITNLGALGVETFTPVLNAPEVAILGVGGLTIKPVRKDGSIALVDAITLSLTIDHQAVDGAPGARFLKDLCEALENIENLLKD